MKRLLTRKLGILPLWLAALATVIAAAAVARIAWQLGEATAGDELTPAGEALEP